MTTLLSTTPPPPSDVIDQLLPLVLLSSVKSFLSLWRQIKSKLIQLQNLLSKSSPNSESSPLLLRLLSDVAATLQTLSVLSSRCAADLSAVAGKLLLRSDLNIAYSLLCGHIQDLILITDSQLSDLHTDAESAIVLSFPAQNAKDTDYVAFVRDCFARIKIGGGGVEMKQMALDSLCQLVSSNHPNESKICVMVAKEGDIRVLIRLLDPSNHSLIRELALNLVSILCCGSETSRKAVFEEGGLGQLLKLIESGSTSVKEKSIKAIEAITSDRSNAWAVSAYNGIEILIDACRCGNGSPTVNALACGALKNILVIDDFRVSMIEEGALVALIELIDSGTNLGQKNASTCLYLLAGDEKARVILFREKGLDNLMKLVLESSDLDVVEHGLRAIEVISLFIPANRLIAMSYKFIAHIAELIKIGNISIQLILVSLISSLHLYDESKRILSICIPSIILMMGVPKPANVQEVASEALVSLLSVKSNRIELSKEGKSMMKLVLMLDLKRVEICKKSLIRVLIALGVSDACRKRLNELGVCEKLQKLVDADVEGARHAMKLMSRSKLKKIFSLGR